LIKIYTLIEFAFFKDVSVFAELKRRSNLRETKKEKDKAAANKRKSAAAPSTASKRRQSSQETPKGAKGEDDVDEVRTAVDPVIT